MSHMRRLLGSALLLLLICCVYGCAASDVLQPLPQKGQSILDAHTVAVGDLKKEGKWEPIRIRVFTEGVKTWLTACTKYRPSMWGRGIPPFCTGDSLITPEKVKIIEDVVVEGAKLHMDRLRIQRGPRRGGVMPLNRRNRDDLKENCPDALPRPAHHHVGLRNGDFAVFVSPSVSHEEARICTNDTDGRPTSALIKVNTATIKHTRHYVRLAAHDIGHGLGFMVPVFTEHNLLKRGGTNTGRGVRFLNTSVVLDKAKEHYGCPTLFDMQLDVRDEGFIRYIWVAYPHWKRRYAKDELMSVYLDRPSGMYYTALTLAAFHSMPFYEADFSKAETMPFGKNAGCKFVQGKCIEKDLPINPDMFCVDESKKLRCTTDRRSLGKCSIKSLPLEIIPNEFNYFTKRKAGSPYSDWMDYCPVIEPTFDTSCELGKEDKMPGSLVSNTSVCLDVKSVVLSNNKNSEVEGICAKVECGDGILKVQYKGNDDWHDCKDGGFIDNLKGSVLVGQKIVCPNYTDFCGPKPVPKPAPASKPTTTTKPESGPTTGTSIGSNNESTSTTSNPQTETRPNGTETHEKQPAHTDSQTTEAGGDEEHEESEENEDTVGSVSDESDNDEYVDGEEIPALQAMLNATMNSQNRSAASNGQQGGSGGSQGARGNGDNTGETGVRLPERDMGRVPGQEVRVINDESTDSSMAASSIASLAVLVCVAAAVVAL